VQNDDVDERQSWRAFAVCAVGAALPVIDTTKIYIVAPAMETSLQASQLSTQLAIAGYLLAFGLSLVPAGRYGDLHSRSRTFLFGIALFAFASLVVGIAPNEQILVGARVLQGLSAGILTPQMLGLIQQLFTGAARMRAFGLLGAIFGLATSLAPALGGLLVGVGGPDIGWRLAFLINLPPAIVVLILAPRLLPRASQARSAIRDFDPVGIVLLALATASMLGPFVLTGSGDNAWRWLLLIGVPVFGIAFVAWERSYGSRGRIPLIDLALFRLPSFRNGLLIIVAFYGAMPGTLLLLSLFVQSGTGHSPLVAGIVAITLSVGYAGASLFSGRLLERHGPVLVVIGAAIFTLGLVGTLLVGLFASPEASPWLMMIPLTVTGIGGGWIVPPNQALSMSDVAATQGGLAGSILQVGQRLGTAIGVAVVAAIFTAIFVQESPQLGTAVAGRHGFLAATVVLIAFIGATLVLALIDLLRRRGPTEVDGGPIPA